MRLRRRAGHGGFHGAAQKHGPPIGVKGIVTHYATNVDNASWLLHGKPEPMTPR
jgi:hypothetical protein